VISTQNGKGEKENSILVAFYTYITVITKPNGGQNFGYHLQQAGPLDMGTILVGAQCTSSEPMPHLLNGTPTNC